MKEGIRMIEFKNVEKYYGKFHALKNINIKFEQGELITIIDSSGSGKSTLLRCINGLEKITEGDLMVLGENIVILIPISVKYVKRWECSSSISNCILT